MFINTIIYEPLYFNSHATHPVGESALRYFNDLYQLYNEPLKMNTNSVIHHYDELTDIFFDRLNKQKELSQIDYLFLCSSGMIVNSKLSSPSLYFNTKYSMNCHVFDSRNLGVLSVIQSLIMLNALINQYKKTNAIMYGYDNKLLHINNNHHHSEIGIDYYGGVVISYEKLFSSLYQIILVKIIHTKHINSFFNYIFSKHGISPLEIVIYHKGNIKNIREFHCFLTLEIKYSISCGFFYYCLTIIDKAYQYAMIIDDDLGNDLIGLVLIKSLV